MITMLPNIDNAENKTYNKELSDEDPVRSAACLVKPLKMVRIK